MCAIGSRNVDLFAVAARPKVSGAECRSDAEDLLTRSASNSVFFQAQTRVLKVWRETHVSTRTAVVDDFAREDKPCQ